MRFYNIIGAAAALAVVWPVTVQATTEPGAHAPAVRTINSPEPPAATTVAPAAVPAATSAPTTSSAPANDAKPEDRIAEPAKPAPALPTLIVKINLTSQSMSVQANGKPVHSWKVSTGRSGYATPPGTFKPGWMAKMWYSKQYDDAPMPHSVFFNGGIAVHATSSTGMLGRPASHGCVRLAPGNAAAFYALVSRHGMARTRIKVHGRQPFGAEPKIARRGGDQRRTAKSRGQRHASSAPIWVAGPGRNYPGDSYSYTPSAPRARSGRSTYWTGY